MQQNLNYIFSFSKIRLIALSFVTLCSLTVFSGQLIDMGDIPHFNEIFELLTPYNINAFTKLRLGKQNDAGYVVPKELLPKIERCYTYGAGADISFEKDLTAFNDKIITYIYDHTTDYPAKISENIFFKKEGIGALQTEPLNTLKNHISENKDHSSKIALKVDIEGAEWEVFNALDNNILNNVPLLVIEFHWFTDLTNFELYKQVLKKIAEQFVTFHIHANNCAHYLQINGKIFANVLEVTYVNKKYIEQMDILKEKIVDTNITINCPQFGNFTLDFWL